MKGIFVTGTDTGTGKTLAAAALLTLLRRDGIDAVPMKPVQTGAAAPGRSPDLDVCLHAAGLTPSPSEYRLMCPFLYEPACSPHLAGRMAGTYVQTGTIIECAQELNRLHASLIVEGAGGIMVPLNGHQSMLDLMQELSLPVVIVARGKLGTINHTLLSIRALKSAGLSIAGVLLNDAEPVSNDFVRKDNPGAIQLFGDIDIIGDIPYIKERHDFSAGSGMWKQFEKGLSGEGLQKIKDILA